MNSALKKMICHLLAFALIMFPFQSAQAGVITTDQVVSAATASLERTAVLNFMSRSQTVNEFQAQGLDPQAARDRVAAMSDAEVSMLAGQINALPAGADGGLALLILVVFLVWYFAFRR